MSRERSWTPADGVDLPDLTALPGVVGVGTPPQHALVVTYLDTADLALVRAGIALRRRSGGDDPGWHLSVPAHAAGGPSEVHHPPGGDHLAAPAELWEAVGHHLGDRTLEPVAEIRTHRSAHDLRAPDGRVLARVTDDRVEARALPAADGDGRGDGVGAGAVGDDPVGDAHDDGASVAWRAWGVVVLDGDAAILAAADGFLGRAGALRRDADAAEHELRDRLAAQLAVSARVGTPEPTATAPAREVLHARLAAQAAALLRHDAGIRRGAPDSVHQARVACRRLRAALATFRPLVDRERTDPLRDELRWVARSLGVARDAEVARELLAGLLADQPAGLRRGPVAQRLDDAFADADGSVASAVAEVVGSRRYRAVLADLGRLVADPPWTEVAGRPSDEALLPRVQKDWKRLRRRVDAAGEAAGPARSEAAEPEAWLAYDDALHAARKAAKRLRYACEAVEPVWGAQAKRLRRAAREVTQVLGERQDTTVSRERLVALAAEAERAGEGAFTWGRLHGLEEARAASCERRFWRETWPAARRKRLRRWL